MWITRWNGRCAALALGLLVGACQPTTAPDLGIDFDSDATLSAYETVDSLFASPALAGFQALNGRTPFSGSAAAVDVVATLAGSPQADAGRAYALGLASRVQDIGLGSGPAAAPIISDQHRGVTFVYDPDSDEYTQDPEREGAPSTGVRFVLYETDLAGFPIVEEEIGYADLVDDGDESAEDVAIHLTVVAHETTVLEYTVTLDELETGGALAVHGALQDHDGVQLDFVIEATATNVGEQTRLDVAFDLRVDVRDFSIVGSVTGIEEAVEGDGHVDLVVRHRNDSIRLAVDGQGGQIDGSIFVNGRLFATVTGDASDPVIASGSGEPLTFRELLVLRHIIDGVEDVFDFLEDLLDPVDELIILAIIL
ncbi:MAG: hypothetical protein OEO79_03695 [Gemmatimonadota bacterium]|nr:hypothetical protein [Gemmatimonadota bacterium]MDH3421905.1 hypothetical protein [Gemmatimonadota bacterium]